MQTKQKALVAAMGLVAFGFFENWAQGKIQSKISIRWTILANTQIAWAAVFVILLCAVYLHYRHNRNSDASTRLKSSSQSSGNARSEATSLSDDNKSSSSAPRPETLVGPPETVPLIGSRWDWPANEAVSTSRRTHPRNARHRWRDSLLALVLFIAGPATVAVPFGVMGVMMSVTHMDGPNGGLIENLITMLVALGCLAGIFGALFAALPFCWSMARELLSDAWR